MKQITEDYVSYEITQLLKEKGFDIPCRQAYFNGSLVDYTLYGFCDGELLDCPSQSLALKWLREVHNQHIVVKAQNNVALLRTEYYVEIQNLNEPTTKAFCVNGCTVERTYEEAVEAALKYTLENLI